MPSRLVGGLALPVLVAHHPALELCNTRAWWGSDEPKEYLLTLDHVTGLAADLGILLPPAGPRAETMPFDEAERDAALRRVLVLRSDLYAVVTELANEAHVRRLDTAIRAGARDAQFRAWHAGNPTWVSDSTSVDRALHAFARSAADLLSRARPINACPRCGWVFLNPGGRRKWCSMKWCGNRDKVQRFAERSKSSTSSAEVLPT